jgi:hypothetical protein
MMNSSQTPSDAERAAAAAAESAAAYQKYVVQPGMESVKDKVQQTKQTVQAAAEQVKQQAQAKAGEVKQQAKTAAGEVQQQAQAKTEEVKQQARSLIHQGLAKLPPPVATRVEPLITTAKQRPLPTAAIAMVILLVLRRLLRRSR